MSCHQLAMVGIGDFFQLSCLPKRNICCSPARRPIEVERNSWVILAWLQMENHSKIKGLFQGLGSFVSAKCLFNNTLIFLISHMRVHLKETAQKKKSVSELVPRQLYISFQTGCNDYIQKFYMACGIYTSFLFSFRLPNSSLIVLFINNIRFHKQLSVANMFWIPRQKDDQKQSCKKPMQNKISCLKKIFF